MPECYYSSGYFGILHQDGRPMVGRIVLLLHAGPLIERNTLTAGYHSVYENCSCSGLFTAGEGMDKSMSWSSNTQT